MITAGMIEITMARGMFAEGNSPIAKIIVNNMAKGKVLRALKMKASNAPICLTRPVASLVKTFWVPSVFPNLGGHEIKVHY